MRPLVRYFAEHMEENLRRNDFKGGWEDDEPAALVERLHEETAELELQLGRHTINPCSKLVLREAADVANFAMMIADRVSNEPWPDQGRTELKPPEPPPPVPMLLWCPECGERHLDVGDFATKPHHTHACQYCGHVWRPAIVPTVGVQFLPGFKNTDAKGGG
jgi:hypothetical protein